MGRGRSEENFNKNTVSGREVQPRGTKTVSCLSSGSGGDWPGVSFPARNPLRNREQIRFSTLPIAPCFTYSSLIFFKLENTLTGRDVMAFEDKNL